MVKAAPHVLQLRDTFFRSFLQSAAVRDRFNDVPLATFCTSSNRYLVLRCSLSQRQIHSLVFHTLTVVSDSHIPHHLPCNPPSDSCTISFCPIIFTVASICQTSPSLTSPAPCETAKGTNCSVVGTSAVFKGQSVSPQFGFLANKSLKRCSSS